MEIEPEIGIHNPLSILYIAKCIGGIKVVTDIKQWLENLELSKYEEVFRTNAIDMDVLNELDESDLEKLGVAALGHRKKMLRAIASLSNSQGSEVTSNDVAAIPRQHEVAIPKHIAERITAEADGRLGERKFVTVFFADIYQSTALTEDLDPEDAQHLLDSAIDQMAAAVHRYDGIVNKVLGDGIMALFGAPLALEDHAVRACYAALSMQDAMRSAAAETRRQFGTEIQARIGLHSGEVLVRAIKNDFSVDYDATGSAVHIASRMEQLALPGTIRLSHETRRLVGDLATAQSLGPLSIKGLSEPLEVYELLQLDTGITRHIAKSRNQSPLIGRRQDLSIMQQAWQSAVQGRGQAIIISGDAGVGKSRLYQDFLASLPPNEGRILRGNFPVHGEAMPFQGLVSLLSEYFGINPDDSHDQLRERLSVGLSNLGNASVGLRSPLLALFQVPLDDDQSWQMADPMQRRRRTLNSLIEFISLLADSSPLVLNFEDLQRADSDSLVFFEEFIEALSGLPILLLLNHRTEFTNAWANMGHCQLRELPPLDVDASGELLDELLGKDEGLNELKGMLVARSGGNPLFLEEALGELVESGALIGEPGQRTLQTPVNRLKTPNSVQGIIAARIDHLTTQEKEVLQIAAVLGDEVPLSLLERIAEISLLDLRAALARLNDLGYLLEAELFPDIVYRFKNAFMQQVTYDGILRSRRRTLHGQLATEIEGRYATRVAEVAEILAHHFEHGEILDVAIKYLLVASEKAEANFQYATGVAFCHRADLLSADKDNLLAERCRALARQGDLLSLLGDWEGANKFYDQVKGLAHDDELTQEVLLRRHNFQMVERDGLRLGYLSHGSGDEILLFVVPGSYNHALFQPLIPLLSQDYRIVSVQLLGQGASDPPRSGQTLKDSSGDIAEIARTIGGRVTGIGISRASNMLTHAALANPDLFDRLVFVSAPADDGVGNSRFPRLREVVEEFNAAVEAEDWPQVAHLMASNVVPEPDAQDLRKLIEGTMMNADREFLRHFFNPNPEMDISDVVADLEIPVLVMHGTADVQAPFNGSEHLARQIGNSQHYAFEGKGHLPMQTATKEFCAALRNFLVSTQHRKEH